MSCSTMPKEMPSAVEFADQANDVLEQRRRNARGGLVEQHEFRVQQQHAGQFEQFLLAAGQRRGRMIGQLPQPEALQDRRGP